MNTPPSQWETFRSLFCAHDDLGIRLDVSRMGLTPELLRAHVARSQEAFDAMQALEAGALANPSERRMVGHYWLRAPDLAPNAELATAILETRDRVAEFAAAVRAGTIRPTHAKNFERVLVIGIGGSALGPQFVADALGEPSDRLAPSFFDNTDPDGFDRVLRALDRRLTETLTIVISKSGGTPETRNGMYEAAAAYRALGLDFGPHAVAITQAGSSLDQLAGAQGFVARFPMWDWVGGRTSVTSAVGILPAALQGFDVRAFLDGAAAMDRWTRNRDVMNNPAALLALAWFHAGRGRGERAMVVLPYKDRLVLLSRYLQQLVMESLGKRTDKNGKEVHQGLSVYGNKGSTDQHAFVQQLRDGRDDFFVTFVEVLHDRDRRSLEVEPGITAGDYLHGLLLGTRAALHESGRPSLTLSLSALNPTTVGALIALFERAVGLYASFAGVNAYDQPGVEAGKKAASSILDLQRRIVAALRAHGSEGTTCEALAAELERSADAETVFHILERLAVDSDRGVERRAGPTRFEAVYRIQG